MKKERLAIWSCAFMSIAILFSCNKELESVMQDNEPVSERQELKEFRATIGQFVSEEAMSPTTKTVIVTDENEDLQLVWAENDTIGIFPASGNQVAFPMSGSAGSKTARFDGGGWGLKSESTYSAYYPLIGQFYLDQKKIPLIMSAQTQDGNGSYAHIGKSDYMAAVNATVNEDGGVDFQFNPLTCLIHMQLKMPARANYTYVSLETSGEFNTEATLDLTTGAVTPTKKSPRQILNLTHTDLSAGEDNPILEVYFSILPVDLSSTTISVKVFDDSENCYSATLVAKNFEAGTIYNYRKITEEDLTCTGLPRVLINTPGNAEITSKEEWIEASSIMIINTDGTIDYEANDLSIRGRGNSTWGFPKKPYALKLGKKAEILGMSKHKRWVLLANWMDRTSIRNDVAFQIAKKTSLSWTPNGKFVEVILNGMHLGNYYLCEQIKVDKNRVNIAEMKSTDVEGDAITGGYLVELDVNFDEVNKFYSATRNLPYMFKEPDEDVLQPVQLDYFQNYVNTMESYLYADNWLENREYTDYIDIGSFIDWWFVYELSMNSEPGHPKSTYMHKDRLGKLIAGPVWDFDWATFVPSKTSSFQIKNSIYYNRLFEDSEFITEVKRRWTAYKPLFEQIPAYIRDIASQIEKSNEIDHTMWPLSPFFSGQINGDQDLSFEEAIERLSSTYMSKFEYMDNQISQW